MSVITINIFAKKKVVPVQEQLIADDSDGGNRCGQIISIELVPVGTKYLEVIIGDIYGSANRSSGIIGGGGSEGSMAIQIDAFVSPQENLNTITSSITVNLRASIGGTIEDSYRMTRNHTGNIC